MTIETLERMAESVPDEMLPDLFPHGRVPSSCPVGQDPRVARLWIAARDHSFGWRYAQAFARRKRFLPITLPEQDRPVLEAHYYCRDPRRFGSDLIRRVMLLASPQSRQEAGVVRAMLLVRDLALDLIAERLRLPVEVVGAYEKLFFNVRDRMDDLMYLRALVYPDSRLARLTNRAPLDRHDGTQLLAQSALDNGAEHVLYLAGVGRGTPMSKQDARTQMEQSVLGQAAILAQNGFLDASELHQSITIARQLMSADKLGGQQDDEDPPPGQDIGNLLMRELTEARTRQIRDVASSQYRTEDVWRPALPTASEKD